MKNQPDVNYESNDVVLTPALLAKKIIEHFPLKGRILDPCRGAGAFFSQFPEDCEKLWCEISEGKDFFAFNEKVDWCVSNPPYSLFRTFLIHSMEVANDIVYLITVNHMWTKARVRDLREFGFGMKEIFCVETPDNFPPSGFQYAAVHISKGYEGEIKLTFASDVVQNLLV